MSFVIKSPAARIAFASRLQTAGFASSARAMTGASRHENDPEVLQKGKESVLRKHSKGSKEEPHWHEEVASDAEAFVKAQRDEIEASGESIKKLQEKTAKIGKQQH